jgi:hypothetical protein
MDYNWHAPEWKGLFRSLSELPEAIPKSWYNPNPVSQGRFGFGDAPPPEAEPLLREAEALRLKHGVTSSKPDDTIPKAKFIQDHCLKNCEFFKFQIVTVLSLILTCYFSFR